MAALFESTLVQGATPEVVNLRQLAANELDQLLNLEVHAWDRQFSWDFRPSADLVKRYVNLQSLQGFALRLGSDIVGYSYQVCEERKGVIGDFYVMPGRFAAEREQLLLHAVVQSMMDMSGIRRIESQLMLLRAAHGQILPYDRYLRRHDRYFMEIDRRSVLNVPAKPPSFRAHLQTWTDRVQEDVAHLISAAYRGHVDSDINDQYRTIPGARRFLTNIIQYPGCGRFNREASYAAVDETTGRVCGTCLASQVSSNTGHITQLCVLPGIRGSRIGYELLRHSIQSLVQQGLSSISLTVTCSNVDAIRLYQSIGFTIHSTFPALVWEGF